MNNFIAAIRCYHRFRTLRKALRGKEGSHIEPELLLLRTYLDPNKAFFDVGANVGEYIYVAKKYIPLANIVAFEPQQSYVQELRAFFPGLKVERCALSNAAGERRLKIPLIRDTLYRTRGTLEDFQEVGEDGAEFEVVPTVTLDEAVQRLNVSEVGCIKIDVEGHEGAVLEGAIDTLLRDKPTLIIEIEQRHHKEPIEQLFKWLQERGYKGNFFDHASQSLLPMVKFSTAVHQQSEAFKTPQYIRNFIFIPHV